ELLRGGAEEGGEPLNFRTGESPLPAAALSFGRTYGGGRGPAHQHAELTLAPSPALPQGPDVRADDGELLLRNLIDATAPPACHVGPASGFRMRSRPCGGGG